MAQEFLDVWQGYSSPEHPPRPRVPELVGMDVLGNFRTVLPGGVRVLIQRVGDVVVTHRMEFADPDRVEKQGPRVPVAGVEQVQILLQMLSGLIHDGQRACLLPFSYKCCLSASGRGPHIRDCQVQDLLDVCCGVKEQQDHCGVSQASTALLSRCANQRFNGGHTQGIRSMLRCPCRADSFDVQPDRNEGWLFPRTVREE